MGPKTEITTDTDSGRRTPFRRLIDSRFGLPRRVSIAFTVILIALQISLATFIIREYRALQIKANGEIGSIYIDTLLAPYALSQIARGLDPQLDIETAFRQVAISRSETVLRIWRLDGTLLFSTFGGAEAVLHEDDDLAVALTGRSISKLEVDGILEPGFPLPFPFLEIYAPIHDPLTQELIAVGELYQDATGLLRERTYVEAIVGLGMIGATACVLAMLALSFRLSHQLQSRVIEAQNMAEMNDRLRIDAEQARLDGAKANEQMLNLIGAELHDGPVQLLGLVTLMDGAGASNLPNGTSARSLIDEALMELRTMAAGLILPELESLTAGEVVDLAIERNHALVGSRIDCQVGPLDFDLELPRKICLYRVIQEGMANAIRHGDGHVPRLTVVLSGHAIDIRVEGQSRPQDIGDTRDATRRLGLQGMRRRLNAFGGWMTFTREDRTTVLQVMLPVAPDRTV